MAMENLFTAADASLGLNIVSVPAEKTTVVRRAKKKNKYEKRRRKAKEAQQDHSGSATFRQSHRELHSQTNAAAGKEEDRIEEENDVNDHENTDEEEHADELANASDENDADDEPSPSLDNQSEIDAADESPQQENPLSTNHLPGDEEERAKYLAEFHARPMELDRRAGVSSRSLARSKDSTHLFTETSDWNAFSILHPKIVDCLQNHLKLDKPTVIQSRTLPAFLQGDQKHNLLIHSETGSGKTLAYLLPILQSLAVNQNDGQLDKRQRDKAGTRCIILCPTRELASQILTVVEQVCSHTFNWIVAGCLLGEERRKSEKARIRKGVTILAATPGRMLDHLAKTECLLMACKGKVEWLVLDEADRLLDLGLGDQVKQIVQRLRANQPGSGRNGITWRSVLISATITSHVETLAKDTMIGGDNSWVWVKGGEEVETTFADSTPRQVSQNVITVSAKLKLAALVAFLVQRAKKGESSVVFMDTCAAVDFYHALFLSMSSILSGSTTASDAVPNGIFGQTCPFYKLHGSVPHGERQQILRRFLKRTEEKTAGVLLATDVAARGLNLPDVDWTIQYDPPSEVADYVHRTGRVGRAGRKGHSLLFLLSSERSFLDVLKKQGVKKMNAVSLTSTLNAAALICEQLTQIGMRRSGGGSGGFGGPAKSSSTDRKGEAFCTEVQNRLEDCIVKDDAKVHEEAKAARKELTKGQRRHKPKAVTGTLMELARNAYISHLRAYPTKEKSLRNIFATKSLHYGHVARSFALKEPPTKLTKETKTPQAFVDKESKKQNKRMSFDQPDGDAPVGERVVKKTRREDLTPYQAKVLLMANASRLEQQSNSY
ncbi:hypothetical protein MPSEU_000935100 [Mayamaea pseudoterrestris]|nr:hypothetical protein MPSEU_000935100 [Mayamaea pseudoterrestris]